ncbi:hypothetical protein [Aquimarina litoralis]|uniref:hypothetical protein n=1 Tax=Aquimarina litoralis TaxID=584605 RepID=UPI001C562ADB|nr:hypothetical protein [Aquimarina litoralis]MBW1296382.1 hypothetical protein [Aquimarina litoralis]
MKKYPIFLLFLILSCKNTNEKKDWIKTSEKITAEEKNQENTNIYNSEEALWEYQFDKEISDFKINKVREFNPDTLSIQKITNIINLNWPKVQVKYVQRINDTIFLKIPNSKILTQQMGTTGAEQFLISTTFSFTELDGVNYVSYEFETGDHASPGIYGRESWAQN